MTTAPTPTTYGADLAEFQAGISVPSLKAQGYEFLIARTSDGATYADRCYAGFRQQAEDNAMLFAAYHFLRSTSSPAAQAAHVASLIVDKRVPVFIDCEPNGTSRPTVALADEFHGELQKLGIRAPVLYLPNFWWSALKKPNLGKWVLWQALYGANPRGYGSAIYPGNTSSRWAKQGGVTPTLLQFGSEDKVDGFAGNVDVDAFRGTRDELAALGIFHDYEVDYVQKHPVGPPLPKPVPKSPKPRKKGDPLVLVGTWNVERDRPAAEVAHDLDVVLPHADAWLLQECQGYDKELAAAAERHGFGAFSFHDAPEQNESPILVRRGIVTSHGAAEPLTTHGWLTVRGGHTPPKWSTIVVADGVGLESVHTPPTVQSLAKRLASPRRWGAYKQLMRRLSGQQFRAETVVGGDWNVDARTDKGGNRYFPRKAFGAMGLARVFPRAGTHGSRVIDGFGVKGVRGTAKVLDLGHSDHRPVVLTIHRRNV